MSKADVDEIKIRLAYAMAEKPLPGRLSGDEVIAFFKQDSDARIIKIMAMPVLKTMADTMFIYMMRKVLVPLITPKPNDKVH